MTPELTYEQALKQLQHAVASYRLGKRSSMGSAAGTARDAERVAEAAWVLITVIARIGRSL